MPERRGEARIRGLVPKGSGAVRRLFCVCRKVAQAAVKPEGREGERPREAKSKRAKVPGRREIG